MAKIVEYRDISLDDLVIGKGQARVQNPGRDVEDLARSIENQGLLQPIVVCQAEDATKWEILTGQRRFLAHQWLKEHRGLKEATISAAILDHRVDEAQAKAISITENLIRRNLSNWETKEGVTYLYNRYGSIKDVVEATGLPQNHVRNYVKADRLIPELKEMVKLGKVDVNAALKAQDASVNDDGSIDNDVALKLAGEMESMSGAQRHRVAKERKEHPERSVDEVIESAKSGSKVTQIVATITQDTHRALRRFASEEDANQDDAAVMLIEESLVSHGFLEKEG